MSGESTYVTLISSDGYSFIVQRSSACISGAIKRMLDPSCTSTPLTSHIDTDDGRHQPRYQPRYQQRTNIDRPLRWLRRIQNQHVPLREHQVSSSRVFAVINLRE